MRSTKTIRLRTMMLWSMLLVFLANTNAFAQSAKVNGAVTDERGAPVPGVTVTVMKTSRSTVTDAAGKFMIEASPKDVLAISAVGFTSQEIKAGTGELSIQLKEAVNQLDNVIVIGYGTQKKKLVTGATSQVKGEDLAKLNTTNALQALQGQAAGVNITSTSGQPGGGFKVNIRGAGTIGNANPLYVVDGVITGDITELGTNAQLKLAKQILDSLSIPWYIIPGNHDAGWSESGLAMTQKRFASLVNAGVAKKGD